jgi:hypothetical protein
LLEAEVSEELIINIRKQLSELGVSDDLIINIQKQLSDTRSLETPIVNIRNIFNTMIESMISKTVYASVNINILKESYLSNLHNKLEELRENIKHKQFNDYITDVFIQYIELNKHLTQQFIDNIYKRLENLRGETSVEFIILKLLSHKLYPSLNEYEHLTSSNYDVFKMIGGDPPGESLKSDQLIKLLKLRANHSQNIDFLSTDGIEYNDLIKIIKSYPQLHTILHNILLTEPENVKYKTILNHLTQGLSEEETYHALHKTHSYTTKFAYYIAYKLNANIQINNIFNKHFSSNNKINNIMCSSEYSHCIFKNLNNKITFHYRDYGDTFCIGSFFIWVNLCNNTPYMLTIEGISHIYNNIIFSMLYCRYPIRSGGKTTTNCHETHMVKSGGPFETIKKNHSECRCLSDSDEIKLLVNNKNYIYLLNLTLWLLMQIYTNNDGMDGLMINFFIMYSPFINYEK